MTQKKITLPEGWEIDKVEGNEIILKESKKELPNTWEECYTQLDEVKFIHSAIPAGLSKSMIAFCRLLICMEVYRQGWKPDWDDCNTKYCIVYDRTISVVYSGHYLRVLTFQSEEIANKFLNNFRDLIEKAKDLI